MEWCLRPRYIFSIFFSISIYLQIIHGKKVAVCLHEGGINQAREIAKRDGYVSVTQQHGLQSCFVFAKPSSKRRKRAAGEENVEQDILQHPDVREAEITVPRIRVKKNMKSRDGSRDKRARTYDSLSKSFKDPYFSSQWHLYNTEYEGFDLNVLPVWAQNITGQGVTVAILDDGVEHTHPDIIDNYNASLSWDLLDDDDDPTPVSTSSDHNDHGTRCAGQVAASKNTYCVVGVAYNSKIAAIRMLKYKVEDAVEAKALKYKMEYIDIYSSSWGPIDDGKKVDGPGLLVRTAFEEGTKYGRNGKGSIYVWASGNGGVNRDNCNCDGYCSSIYTISISAVNEKGVIPHYVESCTATLAAAYSSGTNNDRRIVTTDINAQCKEVHGGTSAAAPLAAGVIALALSANPTLTWRDVQHIIVRTSLHNNADCVMNGAGRCVNNKIGYGILDSEAVVRAAKSWVNVGEQHVCKIVQPPQDLKLKDTKIKEGNKLIVQIDTNACIGQTTEVSVLEHVQAVLSIAHEERGALKIDLVSPSGTKSALLTERPSDKNTQGFNRWSFLTVHMWGEPAAGRWALTIDSSGKGTGELTYFELRFYGTKYNNSAASRKCSVYAQVALDGKVTCVTTCQRYGYYQSGNMCMPCNRECNTCNEFSVCTSCPEGLFLLHEDNSCIDQCPEGYTTTDSILSGKICTKSDSSPWYKGDMVYIIAVVTFIVTLIGVVMVISIHHYRKHKRRSRSDEQFRSPHRISSYSSSIPHRPLIPAKPILVGLPSSRDQHNNARDHHNNTRDHHNNARDQYNNARDQHNSARDQHNNARDHHNNARDHHNNARDQHNNARDQHNNARDQHNNARDQHNTARADPNLHSVQVSSRCNSDDSGINIPCVDT